jgi:hypothetical protein
VFDDKIVHLVETVCTVRVMAMHTFVKGQYDDIICHPPNEISFVNRLDLSAVLQPLSWENQYRTSHL